MDFRLFLESHNIEYKAKESVARLSFVGIGGHATLATYPKNRGELLCLLSYLVSHKIPYKVVGNMSNILPPDSDWGICLVCTKKMRAIYFENDCTVAECGVPISALCKAMFINQRIPPIELFGIPATVGGAVYQNAGAYDLSISDRILSVDLYDPRIDRVVRKHREALSFTYRHSSIASEGIVLSICISHGNGCIEDAEAKMKELYHRRRQTQPSAPSLGSVFLRADNVSAAYYIECAGLKGTRIGDAMVSPKHAGFIVNTGNASAEDYRKLIDLVSKAVYERFCILLKTEIEIITEKEKNAWDHFA